MNPGLLALGIFFLLTLGAFGHRGYSVPLDRTNIKDYAPVLLQNSSHPEYYNTDFVLQNGKVELAQGDWRPDPSTFVVLNGYYFKDKNYIYSMDAQSDSLTRITYADRTSFQVLHSERVPDGLAKDKNHVYLYGSDILPLDPSTTQILGSGFYIRDSKRVLYYHLPENFGEEYLPLTGADAATFTLVSGAKGYDARDKNYTYLKGERVQ